MQLLFYPGADYSDTPTFKQPNRYEECEFCDFLSQRPLQLQSPYLSDYGKRPSQKREESMNSSASFIHGKDC